VKWAFSRRRYSNGVEVAGGREAGLRAGDVEADDALVAVAHGQRRDLAGPGGVPHRGQQGADADPVPGGRGPLLARTEAVEDRLDDLR
jgi:hypothetical protein